MPVPHLGLRAEFHYLAPMLPPLPDFTAAHVLVLGDAMLDRTIDGRTERISPEAPVPVVALEDERYGPGGAGNVAAGIVALGARCTLIGARGDDPEGTRLERALEDAGVTSRLERIEGWPTTTKLRIVSRGQQLLRVDREAPLPGAAAHTLLDAALAALPGVGALLISDYDKGAIADPGPIIAAARRRGIAVIVDPKYKPLAAWRGAAVVKPNRAEFEAMGGDASSEAALTASARELLRGTEIDALMVTRGGEGLSLVAEETVLHLPAFDAEVFDVTGAGDSVAAVVAAALACGAGLQDAARIANAAGAAAVAQHGTTAVRPIDIERRLRRRRADGTVLDREHLIRAVQDARRRGERIVFTNGCFDILHAGHASYLEEAAALGDRLIVAVNDDASVGRLKGPGRPLNRLADRMHVLAALAPVDWVVDFAEDTPLALLEALRPDVLVKGGDYRLDEVVGADLVRSWGGEVVVVSHLPGASSSALIGRLDP